MAKLTSGTVPHDGKEVARFGRWALYDRGQQVDSDWRSFKLILAGHHRGPANFRFGWNGRRLSGCEDAEALSEHHPEICSSVVEFLAGCHSVSTQADFSGFEHLLLAKGGRLPRAKNIQHERMEQEALVQWVELQPWSDYFAHWPNERQNRTEAWSLARQGVRKGMPDNWLFLPRRGHPGAVSELKRREGGRVNTGAEGLARTSGGGWVRSGRTQRLGSGSGLLRRICSDGGCMNGSGITHKVPLRFCEDCRWSPWMGAQAGRRSVQDARRRDSPRFWNPIFLHRLAAEMEHR